MVPLPEEYRGGGESRRYLNSLEIIFKIPVQQKLAKAEYDLLAKQYLLNKTLICAHYCY